MRPLTLTAEMALAAMQGPKRETRRPLHPGWVHQSTGAVFGPRRCRAPFGQPGEWCWLREPGRVVGFRCIEEEETRLTIEYPADKDRRIVPLPERFDIDNLGRWPSWVDVGRGIPNGIFREAARLKTLILEVRVERLLDITEEGARAEGVEAFGGGWPGDNATWRDYQLRTLNGLESARESFLGLWDSIYAKRGLGRDVNPWATVTKFNDLEAI